ncbi:MAG: 3-dehydroquinate synthase [Lachnospiraceae bacterium]|nr:3-dehydroquinate synthase [Lachnospiraceae bacterium]
MNDRLTVHDNGEPVYDIVFTNGFELLVSELEKLKIAGRKVCIVTETTVGAIYSQQVMDIVTKAGGNAFVYTFPAGEENKNLDIVKKVYEYLILNHFDRKDVLIALGGGVTGDLTGFTAATYLRGIDFIQIPTSLLSQVDSSVGGKTGVDFDSYKNMVGAFYHPKLVYINTDTLKTLTKRQFLSGMGEVVKYGLIKRRDFLTWLMDNCDAIKNYDVEALKYMIYVSCDTKREVVENDFTELGERALLNMGHTLGHAIEKCVDFRLLHGECVSIGSVASAYISYKKGYITKEDVNLIINAHKMFELPVSENTFDDNAVLSATLNDKKMEAGTIKFVVLNEIGKAVIDRSITKDDMADALSKIKAGDFENYA